ncbi:hypothetical protein SCB71_13040 [Herbiconiux sp. KACC 21604]|uniref:hypothetical protein n=1 Tax=unclassified Herbiconiux TaxID=2618217 RepID=UPI001491E6C1|nr:hypothetical protein [Herbiconiux sp. SALV-R1]QJU54092.1 hypothetical protein HL652_10990 [Herbiconiux sp. SALV-R1]WPO85138.1 hypothetical protein SCB71_13040 [Herbiconiux sp. KACC 21604]
MTDSNNQGSAEQGGNEPVDLSDIEYPDYAGYPDGEGVVGNGPTTDAVPSGVDPTVADEPENDDAEVPTDDDDIVENDG